MFDFLFVPTILFMVIVAPIWIIKHYQSLNNASQGLDADDKETLDSLLDTIDKMADRIDTLESILDDQQPDWRNHNARQRGE